MGAAPLALVEGGPTPRGPRRRASLLLIGIACGLLAATRPAAAEDCWMSHRHGPFPVCFDPGNRLRLDATTGGLGGAIQLRHTVPGDDPDVSWRLEHQITAVRIAGSEIRAAAYSGRYVRHSTDGHLVIPFGRPRKVFLPFDIGAEAEVGSLRGSIPGELHVGAVRTAALIELSRASHFRRRVAIGPVARWDLEVDTDSRSAREHAVAPFTVGALDLRAESASGLTLAGARAEAGGVWSTDVGWRRWLSAEAEIERVLVAVQDRPVSLFVSGEYQPHEEALSGLIGVRLAPMVRIPAQGR